MIGRIIEIAEDHRHLSVARGFLIVEDTRDNRSKLAQIPINDIGAIIGNAYGLSYTNSLLVALAERGVPFVLCATNHNVIGMLLSVDGNFQQAKRFDAQIASSVPLKKRLWAEIVKYKLQQQATVLLRIGISGASVLNLVKKVRSGDPENYEAQGAKRYWNLLFGDDFRRDQKAFGINAMLNYGYTVLRTATARAVVSAGLHPTLGLHHSNEGNAMRLVDDLMEPFRPLIDLKVFHLSKQHKEVTLEVKRSLVKLLYEDIKTNDGNTPVMAYIQQVAISLAQIFLGENKKFDFNSQNLAFDIAKLN